MRWSALATALAAGAMVAGWGDAAGAQQAARVAPRSGRYSDPHLGVYTWQGNATGRDALLFYLSSQYRQAQLMREDQAAAGAVPAAPAASPYHRMRPGGAAAGGYFGRTAVVDPMAGPAAPSRYNRLGPYFGGRGR